MTKFKVGNKYKGVDGKYRQCLARTDKFVWLGGYKCKIKIDCEGNEYTTTVIRVPDFKSYDYTE